MKPIYVVLSTLAGIAIILLGIKYRKNIITFFSPKENLPSKSDYEKCVEANKAKADGVSCSNCVPDGSGMPNFNGVIRNGVCERVAYQTAPSDTRKIRITKEGGTRTFSKDSGGNIVSPQNANMIPKGAVLTVTESVTSPAPYYNTMYGWIDANDAVLVS